MQKVLFVCSANRCRSVFAKYASELMDSDFIFESAGVNASDGKPATNQASETALDFGIELDGHKSRNFKTLKSPDEYKVIICFTENHYSKILSHKPQLEEKCFLLSRFTNYLEPGENISDPTGQGPESHKSIFSVILDSLRLWQAKSWNFDA